MPRVVAWLDHISCRPNSSLPSNDDGFDAFGSCFCWSFSQVTYSMTPKFNIVRLSNAQPSFHRFNSSHFTKNRLIIPRGLFCQVKIDFNPAFRITVFKRIPLISPIFHIWKKSISGHLVDVFMHLILRKRPIYSTIRVRSFEMLREQHGDFIHLVSMKQS